MANNDALPYDPDDIRIVDDSGHGVYSKTIEYPKYAQGKAELAIGADGHVYDQIAEDREESSGYTNPDLHRRIAVPKITDVTYPSGTEGVSRTGQDPREISGRNYEVTVGGVNSYRTEEIIYHLDYQDITVDYLVDKFGYSRDYAESYLDEFKQSVAEQEKMELP